LRRSKSYDMTQAFEVERALSLAVNAMGKQEAGLYLRIGPDGAVHPGWIHILVRAVPKAKRREYAGRTRVIIEHATGENAETAWDEALLWSCLQAGDSGVLANENDWASGFYASRIMS